MLPQVCNAEENVADVLVAAVLLRNEKFNLDVPLLVRRAEVVLEQDHLAEFEEQTLPIVGL